MTHIREELAEAITGSRHTFPDSWGEEVVDLVLPVVTKMLEEAWDAGATKASPFGGGYLRSLLIENPYRSY